MRCHNWLCAKHCPENKNGCWYFLGCDVKWCEQRKAFNRINSMHRKVVNNKAWSDELCYKWTEEREKARER